MSDGGLHAGATEARECLRRLDVPDVTEACPDLAEGAVVASWNSVLNIRVLARLRQLRHRVQLAVQVRNLLRDVANFHLVLGILEWRWKSIHLSHKHFPNILAMIEVLSNNNSL